MVPRGIDNEIKPIKKMSDDNIFIFLKDSPRRDKIGKNAREQLIKLGFSLQADGGGSDWPKILNASNNTINSSAIYLKIKPIPLDKNFYLVCSGQDLFLIDTRKTISAYKILTTNMQSSSSYTVTAIEKINKDKYRFFLDGIPGNGRLGGVSQIEVHEIDFDKETQIVETASFALDLNGDGHRELIVEAEIAFGINWYWIYSYQNGSWVETSHQFPGYYKTEVKKLVEEQKGFDLKYGFIRKALLLAAEKGGVSAYIK